MNVTYCPKTGKPYNLEYDDHVEIGIHKKGSRIVLPLFSREWQVCPMVNKFEIILTSNEQIDSLIERLINLKKLKAKYNEPAGEIIL